MFDELQGAKFYKRTMNHPEEEDYEYSFGYGGTDLLDVAVENSKETADVSSKPDGKVDNKYFSDDSDEDHGYDGPADLTDDWLFKKSPIHSALTIKSHAAAVMGFAIHHNCSEKEMNNLLALIKLRLSRRK
eukprot:Seg1038.5 transcript_id=Seg1038.5/GoldUCD/mRNA.D3Y31 product="hypothetical protein" protein_id=Seg1038.5/GoldUCD/D3Y31